IITSLIDTVTIQNTIVNRGNCHAFNVVGNPNFVPLTLKFGEVASIMVTCEKVLEVVVSTDRGDYSFTWNK
ncbi:MAG: hypothetical protein WA231_04180, partial [Methylocella sp.]